jgi:hypothetical protein
MTKLGAASRVHVAITARDAGLAWLVRLRACVASSFINRAELDVLPDRLPKWRVCGQPGLVERLQIHIDESLTLLVGNLQVPVKNQVR